MSGQVHPIVARVAVLYGVPPALVMQGGGTDRCEMARQDAMALLRAAYEVSYRGLGKRFGVDHLQAKAAVKNAEARIRRDHVHAAKLLNLLFAIAETRAAA